MLRFALTGGTGLLGRNLLFEILKQNLNNLDKITIFFFGRGKDDSPFEKRILEIICDDGSYYLGFSPETLPLALKKQIFSAIIPVEFDLAKGNLGINPADFDKLKKEPIDYFYHLAAMTDFRSGAAVEEKLEKINVEGTKKICSLIENLNVKEVIYISSAYACGSKTGLVKPDYTDVNEIFRNPYEKTKLKAEIYFRDFSSTKKIKWRVFRPSTICGRLIEQPIGATNKFDVFYAWAAFFLRLKLKAINSLERIYSEPFQISIRIHFNPKGGLNIVPADYAAKILYSVCLKNLPSNYFHLANNAQTPNQLYGDLIFKTFNISGFSYVLTEPEDKNKIEEIYYRTVGGLFTPYGISEEIIFDTENLKNTQERKKLFCPPVDKENFQKLIDFAKEKLFGLTKENQVTSIK